METSALAIATSTSAATVAWNRNRLSFVILSSHIASASFAPDASRAIVSSGRSEFKRMNSRGHFTRPLFGRRQFVYRPSERRGARFLNEFVKTKTARPWNTDRPGSRLFALGCVLTLHNRRRRLRRDFRRVFNFKEATDARR